MKVLRFILLFCAGMTLLSACANDDHEGSRCTDIPANGCPLDGTADVCSDPTCAAAYACNPDGSWTLDHTCTAFVPDAGTSSARDASTDAGHFSPDIDAPAGSAGGPGCSPLESPDCTYSLALACRGGCCECDDFFACESGEWIELAVCDDGGIVPTQN